MVNCLNTRDLAARLKQLNSIKDDIDSLKEDIKYLSDEIFDVDDTDGSDDKEYLKNKLDNLFVDLSDLEDEFDQKEFEELEYLELMVSEFNSGTLLIPEEDFEDYIREDTEGDEIPSYLVIDWAATAGNLIHDYSVVDYLGDTYLYRG